jgi:glycosyltransferase involved in cell wall biosynthesis
MSAVWHLITGEFPPKPGGVGDYSQLVAHGLATDSRTVHVWTMGGDTVPTMEDGVTVHRMVGRFGPASLWKLSRELKRLPMPRRLLVQYVPFMYGFKALNVPFTLWLWWRRRWHGDSITTMMHEVWFPWVRRPLKHNVLAATHRVMAWLVVRASRTVFISTPAWEPLVRSVHRRANVRWCPVPSNIPRGEDAAAVQAFRASLSAGPVVAHFGTYGEHISAVLQPACLQLFEMEPNFTLLLLGRHSEAFKDRLVAAVPGTVGRIVAAGALPPERVAVALQAADVVLQPFPDGASARRGSLMAALANGCAVVTNLGSLSEPLWADSALAPLASPDSTALALRTLSLLHDHHERNRLAQAALNLYQTRFDLRQTLDAMESCE